MAPADQVAAQRALYVDKLDELVAQLTDARGRLPAAEAAAKAAQVEYDGLRSFVMAPFQRLDGPHANTLKELPSATHAWLEHEAKEPSNAARTAFRTLQRQIHQLDEECSKWRGEIEFLDTILTQNGMLSVSKLAVVKRRPPPVVEFDNVIMPAAGVNT